MIRVLSVFTLVCFLLTNVLGGAFANTAVFPLPYKYDNNEIITKCDTLSEYAQITENIYKKDTPLVVVIHDLHNNSKVQQNIEQIINFISNNSKINKIIIEGAPNKQISTKLFSSIENKQFINNITNGLLNDGKISGAESFVIKNDLHNLYGLENWDIYNKNIEQNLLLKNKYLQETDKIYDSFVKSRIYFSKPQLFSLFSQDTDFEQRIINLYEFCNDNNIDISLYSEINKFIAVTKYKNKKNISKDLSRLFNDIKNKIPYQNYMQITALLKNMDVNAKEKLNLIFNIIKNSSPETLLKYEPLVLYFNNIETRTNINFYALMQQTDTLENFVLDNFVDYNEKELILVDKFIHIVSEYAKLSISYDQYKYFEQNKEYLYNVSIKYLDIQSLKTINDILKDEDLKNYHLTNEQRNKIFYGNIKSLINISDNDNMEVTETNIIENLKNIDSVNIVVVGGFHSELTDILKHQNVSVLSVIPRVEQLTDFDNELVRTENVVYKNALAPPTILIQADVSAIASIIKQWSYSMTNSGIDFFRQKQAIKRWLSENKVDLEFDIVNETLYLGSVPIDDILTPKTRYKKEDNNRKKSTISDIMWKLHDIYSNIKTFISQKTRSIKKLFGGINTFTDISSLSSQYISRKLLNERIIKNEYQRTLNSLNQKMPDVIIISVSSEQDKIFCEQVLADIKTHPSFQNTQIHYIMKEQAGTAEGFIKSMEYLKSSDFGKNFKDLTSVIIDIDTNEKENIARQDLPMKFNGRNITPLELAVLNGIRACHKFKTGGGIAVIDPQSIYIGNMLPTEDITFISSAVNMEEIQHHRHSLIIKDYPSTLEEIYYGFTPENISDIVERKGIEHRNFYNFDNNRMRQFEIATGNILISFDDETKYKEFFNFISEYGNNLNNLSEKTHLFQHIFVPFIRLKNKQNVSSYFAKTASAQDRDIFIDFADRIANYYQNSSLIQEMKFGVYHQSKSLYSRNFTRQLINKLSGIFKSKQFQHIKQNTKSTIQQKQVVITETFDEDNALSRAYKMLSQIQDKQLDSSVDYEQVYDTLIEIFRTTPVQKELYTSENVNTAKLYKYMSDIISNTIAQINNEQISNTNRIERTYLENLKISFLSMQHYTIEYLRLLDYTTNLSTLGSYIFPKSSFFEKSKLMPLNRLIFGLARGIKKSKQNVREQLATVYSSGNFLIDSLYSFPILKNDIESFITSVENPKEKTSVGIQKEWGSRRAVQRFLSLSIALQSFMTTIITALSTSSFTVATVSTAVISLMTGLGLSVFLHRTGIGMGQNDKFYNEKKKEIENELDGQNSIKESMDFFAYDINKISQLEKFYAKLAKNASRENKELLNSTLTLLHQYKENCDLMLIAPILNNSRQLYILLAGRSDLQLRLLQFIDYLEKLNIEDEPKEYKGISHGFVSDREIQEQEINGHLKNWFEILKTKSVTKESIDNIITNATEIIEKTNFNPTVLKGTNKDVIISQLQDFISFYNDTVKLYSALTKQEQDKLRPEIEILEKMGEYATQYYKALNYLVSLEILYGYRVSKGNKLYFLELTGLMSVVRNVYGIQAGIFLSKRRFLKSITAVKNTGNEILNGLYDDKIEETVDSFFKEKESPNYFYLGIIESWKDRKMLSRFLPLVLFIQKVATSVISGSFYFQTFVMSFFTGVGLTVSLHWLSIMIGFFKTLVISKKNISAKEGKNTIETNRQLLLQKHIDELAKVPYGQMPDLIILVGSQSRYTAKSLNEGVRNIRKFGNLQSVPIESIVTKNDGNGNSLLDVFNFIQSKQFEKDYPSLSQKDLRDLKIVVVNINETNSSAINQQLDMEILDKQTTPLELSLLNAVCMIQKNKGQKGNIVIADPGYMYLGNLTQTNNITMFASNVTYEQLKNQSLPLLISNQADFSQDGSSRLKKLYRNFDYKKISNIAVAYMFSRMYDTDNISLVQMPAYAGLIGMNFDDDNNFDLLLKFMNIAREYEQSYKGRKFKIDLIQHLLTPLTMLMNKENIFVYLEVLKVPISNLNPQIKKEYDDFFYGLFDRLNNEFQNGISDSFINVVSSQDSTLTRSGIQGNIFYKNFISLLSTLKNFNAGKAVDKIADTMKNMFVSQKQSGILIVPQLTPFSRHQLFAFDNELSGNIAITSFDQLSDDKKDSGVIINVPVENTVIPAKVYYDVIVDNKGNNHVVVAFMPVLLDNIDMYSSVTETDFIKSILSEDKTKQNKLRKQLFIGRATLAFIKELKSNSKLNFIYDNSDFMADNVDTSYIVSFDDSGLFSVAELIKDDFFTDTDLQNIKHINIVTNQKSTNITVDDIKRLRLSPLVNKYEISDNEQLNLSLLFKLVSNYNYSFEDSDFSLFLKNPKQYAQDMLKKIFDTKTVIRDFSNINTVTETDINALSSEEFKYLLNDVKPESIIIKNVFYRGTELFNIYSLDIYSEIDRLNNTELDKFKTLLDGNNTLNNSKIFVLNNLLQYIKSNKQEYEPFKQFCEGMSPELKKELELLTAGMIINNQSVTEETIEKLKAENSDKWNYYYELNQYMQYIAYIRYQQITELSQLSNTKIVFGIDISQTSLTQTVSQINNLHKMFGINGFKLNGLPNNIYQQQTIAYIHKNITNDIVLIFDDITQTIDVSGYNNIICLSNTVSQETTNHLKVDLSSTEDINDFLTTLSKNNKLMTLYIDMSNVTGNSAILTRFFSLINLLKSADTFDYVEYGRHFINKYKYDILFDTKKGNIKIIDISNIDDMNKTNCFSFVYKVLFEANINDINNDELFELIAHLYMQYEYSNDLNKEKIVLELKGILLAIAQLQQITEISFEDNGIDFNNINSILACA
ncbi:hypothetical protein [Candidatus Ruminimicrobiellum ovillum]|uniref:hypothetical protein n=1 Tax=Candidatus Ruminimicrobiellum ovillum TaxID=1947927 RepID=UPI003559F2E4